MWNRQKVFKIADRLISRLSSPERQARAWELFGAASRPFHFFRRTEDLLDPVIDRPTSWTPKAAIALIGYDRPDYFERVLESLRSAKDFEQHAFYAFLDHAPRDSTQRQIEALQSAKLPFLRIITRQSNLGCGRNIIDARRQLFDRLGYDRVFVFEDDLVVSPNYLSLCHRLLDWAESHFSNVGTVQAWSPCKASVEEKSQKLDQVQASFVNLWGYLMTRECWDSIKDDLYRYERSFLRGIYSSRFSRAIKRWAACRLKGHEDQTRGDRPWAWDTNWVRLRDEFFGNLPSGQDGITAMAMRRQGWVQLTTLVNRAIYIGERGIHMNPDRFRNEKGYHKIQLDGFSSDSKLVEFSAN